MDCVALPHGWGNGGEALRPRSRKASRARAPGSPVPGEGRTPEQPGQTENIDGPVYAVESPLHATRAADDGPPMLSTKGSMGRSSILVLGVRRISGLKAVQSEPDTWLPS